MTCDIQLKISLIFKNEFIYQRFAQIHTLLTFSSNRIKVKIKHTQPRLKRYAWWRYIQSFGVLQITLYNWSCKKWLGIIINKIYVKFMYLIGCLVSQKKILLVCQETDRCHTKTLSLKYRSYNTITRHMRKEFS